MSSFNIEHENSEVFHDVSVQILKNASKSTNGTIFKVAATEANLTAVEEDEICDALETVSKGGSKKR